MNISELETRSTTPETTKPKNTHATNTKETPRSTDTQYDKKRKEATLSKEEERKKKKESNEKYFKKFETTINNLKLLSDDATTEEIKDAITKYHKREGNKKNYWESFNFPEKVTKAEAIKTLTRKNKEFKKKNHDNHKLIKHLINHALNEATPLEDKGKSFDEVKEAVIKAIGEKFLWQSLNFPENITSAETIDTLTELQKKYSNLPKNYMNFFNKAFMAVNLEPLKGKSLDEVKAAIINTGGASLWQSLNFPENITGDELIKEIEIKRQKVLGIEGRNKKTSHASKKRRTTPTANEEILFTHDEENDESADESTTNEEENDESADELADESTTNDKKEDPVRDRIDSIPQQTTVYKYKRVTIDSLIK